jgi:predicted unusual protein kinase regulating ubiquinone biosynthesis (AarF/ABC1/UbiB family)
MNHILPPQYLEAFADLRDNASHQPYAIVERIFREDFGKSPHQVFQTFDPIPVASASVAQVWPAT